MSHCLTVLATLLRSLPCNMVLRYSTSTTHDPSRGALPCILWGLYGTTQGLLHHAASLHRRWRGPSLEHGAMPGSHLHTYHT